MEARVVMATAMRCDIAVLLMGGERAAGVLQKAACDLLFVVGTRNAEFPTNHLRLEKMCC